MLTPGVNELEKFNAFLKWQWIKSIVKIFLDWYAIHLLTSHNHTQTPMVKVLTDTFFSFY